MLVWASRLQSGYRTKENVHRPGKLFGFLVDSVFVAVGAEFFQFQPGGGVTTIFHRGVTINAIGTLVGVTAALGAF